MPSLFPRRDLELTLADTPAVVIGRVERHLAGRGVGATGPERPLVGKVQPDSFEVTAQVRASRNSFRPLIRGRVSPEGGGSRVNIEMKMHPLVTLFMAFWLINVGGFALIGGAVMVGASLREGFSAEMLLGIIIPVGMVGFGLIMPQFGFGLEVDDAEAKIRQVLEGA